MAAYCGCKLHAIQGATPADLDIRLILLDMGYYITINKQIFKPVKTRTQRLTACA